MKYNAYLIPGYGESSKMFKRLALPDCERHYLDWEAAKGIKTYEQYAQEIFLNQIKTDKPIVIVGYSMGGMVAIELAKLVFADKLIIISAAKTKRELPRTKIKLMQFFRPHHWINQKRIKGVIRISKPITKLMSKEHQKLINISHKDLPEGIVNFGLRALTKWKNIEYPIVNYIHIHGKGDKLIPAKRIKNASIIEGGHFLLQNKSYREVNTLIKEFIK